MAKKAVVAVDGPAGSGKSSVSKEAARRLGFDYQDTGAAYRALAWFVLERGIDPNDEAEIVEALGDFDFSIGIEPDNYFVRVGETDVEAAIREPRISAVVSSVARVLPVRAYLVGLFRHVIETSPKAGVITEGRDITTVVCPDAPVRILLTASEEARMARRSAEITGQSAQEVAKQLSSRDAQDSRVVDFMFAADGVTTIDSTHLNFEQTIQAMVDLIHDSIS